MVYKASELELNKLLSVVLERNASDLHLITGEPPVIRVDGKLMKLDDFQVLNMEGMQGIVDVLLNKQQKDLFDKQMDIDLSYSFKDNARFRINIYHQKGLLAGAFRLIPNNIKTAKDLGLPDTIMKFAEPKQGLVLVVGPTGHGKSTAMASLIDYINKTRAEHIVTIEDPIEFVFQPAMSIVNQREIYVDTPSFSQALKAALREDLNVVLVGEMRDLESIQSVITIAETGHLVFATLHTNDASQSIDRILDVFPPHQQSQVKAQLASVLVGVVSLRLLPKVGGGRGPAYEIMIANNAVRNIIREGKTYEIDNVIQTNLEDGMIPLDRSLANLVRTGYVTMEDAKGYVKDMEYFSSLISRG